MSIEERFPLGANVTLDELEDDPHRVFARLRSSEPVSWVPAVGGWVVSRRDLAIEAMRDAVAFTVDDPRFTTGQVVGPSMLSTDGEAHDRHRGPFADPFRLPAVLATFGEFVTREARRLVAEFAQAGSADLRGDLAAPLAVSTVTRALDLVETEPASILGWYRHIVESVTELGAGRTATVQGAEAVESLRAAVERTIAESATSLLTTVAETSRLGVPEIVSNAAVLMFGAIETSEAMTSNALYHLLSNVGQFDRVRDDRSLVSSAVEESLRLEPAASSIDRYATRDVQLGPVLIREGDFVWISLAGANRDPDVFPKPDIFDPTRPNIRQHVTFVHGPHACLGIHLAKLETRVAIEAVLDLLPSVQLSDAATGPTGLIFRKPASVPVGWSVN